MSEIKAAFAERTIRSLKNILYRYMEDYGYKYFHKLPQFIATINSRKNRSIDMKFDHVMNSDFMSILYSKPLKECKKPKHGIVRISKEIAFPSIICRSGKVINHNLHKKFLKLLPLLLKNLQHIQSKTNKKNLYLGNSTRRN